jgi:hypothetical protein
MQTKYRWLVACAAGLVLMAPIMPRLAWDWWWFNYRVMEKVHHWFF